MGKGALCSAWLAFQGGAAWRYSGWARRWIQGSPPDSPEGCGPPDAARVAKPLRRTRRLLEVQCDEAALVAAGFHGKKDFDIRVWAWFSRATAVR